MSTFGKVEIVTGHALVRALAEAFCDLDDERQAEFFIEVAAIARQWPAGGASMQFWRIGRHLATCPCATDDARELVHDLAAGVDASAVAS
jgi:hypothetical protein